jgi:hypothetical protein
VFESWGELKTEVINEYPNALISKGQIWATEEEMEEGLKPRGVIKREAKFASTKPRGLLKTAVTVRSLKNLQHHLAVSGDHRTALKIGEEADLYIDVIACEYLDVDKLPDTAPGVLVQEIAFEAVFADPQRRERRTISLLRDAAEGDEMEALRKAKTQLPDLRAIAQTLEE